MILSVLPCARARSGTSPVAASPAPSAAAPVVWMKRRREIVLLAMSASPSAGRTGAAATGGLVEDLLARARGRRRPEVGVTPQGKWPGPVAVTAKTRRPGLSTGPSESHVEADATTLDGADVRGLQTLRALLHLELHLLALGEGAEPVSLDGGVVAEDVLAPAIMRDKTEALRVVEPLHGTSSHVLNFLAVFGPHSLRVRCQAHMRVVDARVCTGNLYASRVQSPI